MKTIKIDNIEYKLVPVTEENNVTDNTVSANSVLDDYQAQPEKFKGVEIAKPEYLDNRQRLIKLRSRPIPIIKPRKMDGEMDQFGDLVVGGGIQQED